MIEGLTIETRAKFKAEWRRAQTRQLEEMTAEELSLANNMYPLFHSKMEGLGIISEEIFEVQEEINELQYEFKMFHVALRNGLDHEPITFAKSMSDAAIRAAKELLQVAAMCQKYEQSAKKWGEQA